VLGVDEAGYGPLLGPLVVGGTLWRTLPGAARADFWDALDQAVCRRSARGESRLPVGDSKKLYDRKKGITTIERTILAFAHAADLPTRTLNELLARLGFVSGPSPAFPWYRDLGCRLPADPARSAFEGAAGRLRKTMAAAGLVCHDLRAEIVTEAEFNRRISHTRNKAAVILEAVLRMIQWAADHAGQTDLLVLVDRLGGRTDYRGLLMRAFPERHMHVLESSERHSRYRLTSRQNDWEIEFIVDGDDRHLPIGLASMLAKYVREMLMERFNAYWHQLAPDVNPTAGYYKDARRFLTEIGPFARQAGLPAERFVRAR
jgi:ribonuclease HII